MIAGSEGPCRMIMMSANTTVLAFVTFESCVMRLPIIIFHRVGPETDPREHPFVTLLELIVSYLDVGRALP
jgi:hypothetical protein